MNDGLLFIHFCFWEKNKITTLNLIIFFFIHLVRRVDAFYQGVVMKKKLTKNKAIVGSISCIASMESEIKENSFHSKCKF